MTPFRLSVTVTTSLILNKWLTLDAILDGIQLACGVPEDERVVPLSAWDGKDLLGPMTAIGARDAGAVFCGSAAVLPPPLVDVLPGPAGKGAHRIAASQPGVSEISFRGGINPVRTFREGYFPFRTSGAKFDVTTGPSGMVLGTYRSVDPGVFHWYGVGDAGAVRSILDLADGIGAKSRNGFGAIDHATIAFADVPAAPAALGVFAPDGSLARPVPRDLLPHRDMADLRLRAETVRPPYWDKSGAVAALVPATTYDSLLVREGAKDV